MDEQATEDRTDNAGGETSAFGAEGDEAVRGEKKPVLQEETRNPDGTWKKGVSGNPKGRLKKPTIWDYLQDGEDETKIREFINDPKFLDKVAEYILGKPKQPLVGGDEGDAPIQLEISEKIASKNKLYEAD